jgi:hypothetical protein
MRLGRDQPAREMSGAVLVDATIRCEKGFGFPKPFENKATAVSDWRKATADCTWSLSANR